MRSPRKWQAEALQAYREKDAQDFLAVVTPGAGKTFWGLAVATTVEEAERLIVVCPTTEIKNQWGEEAKQFGIRMTDLDRCETNHILTTYQQVALSPDKFEALVGELPSVVIFDEIHHASDKNSWGGLIKQAFSSACRRLCLTGTAFRSDNDQIPFVTYEDGLCSPDFVYGYREAVRDGICREIVPHVFGGEVGWIREGEEEKRSTFADVLRGSDQVARLTAALKPDGGFVEAMIRAADSKLNEFPGDGGLIICKNTNHASALSKTVERVIGEKPVLVHSKLSNPHKKIQKFREGSGRWLVSVQMVSEGVDIERLRVMVYCSNVSTELFLRQAVGRVVRRAGEAHVYFPAHDPFITVIDEIEEDRLHGIEDQETGRKGHLRSVGNGSFSGIVPLFSNGWEIVKNSKLCREVEPSKAVEALRTEMRKYHRDWKRERSKDPEYRRAYRARTMEWYDRTQRAEPGFDLEKIDFQGNPLRCIKSSEGAMVCLRDLLRVTGGIQKTVKLHVPVRTFRVNTKGGPVQMNFVTLEDANRWRLRNDPGFGFPKKICADSTLELIRTMSNEGHSARSICKKLNDLGAKTIQGDLWSMSNCNRVIREMRKKEPALWVKSQVKSSTTSSLSPKGARRRSSRRPRNGAPSSDEA